MKLLSVFDLKTHLDSGQSFTLIDVREPHELGHGQLENAISIPLNDLESRLETLDKQAPTVFICRSGGRSHTAATLAESAGFKSVYNLVGGMNDWAENIDMTMSIY